MITSSRRIRLGTVTGTRTANYVLPWDRSLELRIEIDLLAAETCTTRAESVKDSETLFGIN